MRLKPQSCAAAATKVSSARCWSSCAPGRVSASPLVGGRSELELCKESEDRTGTYVEEAQIIETQNYANRKVKPL